MTESPLSNGARGALVTVSGQMAKMAIQFGGVVILSRLLSPEDFGLIAMVAVFVGLGELLRDFGMPTAALRLKQLSNEQASNFFWVNTALGLAAGTILIAATPLIVNIYGQPALALIVPVLALAPVLNGLQAQIQVRLARGGRFTALAATDVAASLSGLMVASTLAFLGFGYWALVGQTLIFATVLLASRWILASWIPALPRRGVGSRTHVTSGSNFGIAQALNYAASNADTLVIGTQFGPEWAGYYNRAYQLLTVPVNSLLSPLTQVVVPTVNRAIASGRSETDVLLKVQFAFGIAIVWVFTVTASTAPVLIPLVLGQSWEKSITLFQLLAIGGSVQVFSFVSYWSFILGNHGRHLIYYNLVTKPISIALIIGGSLFGPIGVALGYSLGLVIGWPVNLLWLSAISRRSSWPFFVSGCRILGAALLAFGAAVFAMSASEAVGAIGQLLIGALVCSLVYLGLLVALPSSRVGVFSALRAAVTIWKRR